MVLGIWFARVKNPPHVRFDALADDSLSATEKLAKTQMLELRAMTRFAVRSVVLFNTHRWCLP